jgi:predicted permease
MGNDIRYALRAFARERGFAATVVLSLAVGIGANTAIFSLINGVLLRPPAFRDPDRLVAVNQTIPKFAKLYPSLPINIAMLMEWRKSASNFESIGVTQPTSFNFTGAGEPELLNGARVSANIFRVLGVEPRLGRTFLDSEDQAGSDRVVVISDSLWRRKFHGDPKAIGGNVTLDGRGYLLAGVLAPGFEFPNSVELPGFRQTKMEIFRPLGYEAGDLKIRMGEFNYWVTGRLKGGVTPARAVAELNTIQARISQQMPENPDLHASVTPLAQAMVKESRRGLLLLMAAVGTVLLVLWVNLTNLSLVRAMGRAREAAIRSALGAGRMRLLRQSLVESLTLALAGGALGTALAWWGLRALVAAAPVDLPRLNEVTLDGRVLLFAVGVSIAAGILLGILPALRSAVSAPYETLKSGGRALTEGRAGMRVRNGLVSLEVALSAALLVTAALLMGSFVRLTNVDKGFNVEHVITLRMALPNAKYAESSSRTRFYDALLEKAAALPGVQSVALVSAIPLSGQTWIDIVGAEHDSRPTMERPSTNVRFASPQYFKTLGIALDGRDFGNDRTRAQAIISKSLAERLWPGQNPIGRKIDNGRNDKANMPEVVGVTPDIRSTSLEEDPVNMMYIPFWERPRTQASLLVRTSMDPRGIASSLRQMVWAADGDVPVPEVQTMEQVMRESVAARRFQMMLVAIFAVGALLLAAFGTYGVVSYAVTRRRNELGIRMALGAAGRDVLGMVLWQGMAPVIIGLGAGALAALALGRYVASLLFGVSPRDPLAFAAAAGVLLAVSAAACLLPARRATKVNPIDALRCE